MTACSTSPRLVRRACFVLVIVALQDVTLKPADCQVEFPGEWATCGSCREGKSGFGLRSQRKCPARHPAIARFGREENSGAIHPGWRPTPFRARQVRTSETSSGDGRAWRVSPARRETEGSSADRSP